MELDAMDATNKRVFKHTIRVPYAHTDQMKFVYYANYLVYMEMARAEFLREVGLPYAEMEKRGIILPVVVAHCEYKKPAHFDDLLEIRSCPQICGSRLRVEYEIWRGTDLLSTAYTEHVCLNAAGKVMRPAPELQNVFSSQP
jgi:acyl-CoA thioester hydrolase